jgi:site-specific DNA recombinase
MATARKIQTKSGYRIGLYIRASTEEQGSQKNPEGTIKNQELRLKNAIEGRNINANFGEVIEIFIDDGISAKNTKRPELQRMLKAIENKEINMVMVTEYSRLSRNMRDFAGMWELFKDFGCGLISLREQFDTSSAAGEMMLYNMANLAQFERRLTSERVTSSRHDRASRGSCKTQSLPLYRLALLYLKMGKELMAKEYLLKIKKEFPDERIARSATKLLRSLKKKDEYRVNNLKLKNKKNNINYDSGNF